MDSSEKTEIQIKFANWDKWLGAAWNLYSTKGWLLNFTNLDGEINGLCIRRAAGYTHFLTNIRRHFISAIESLCVISRCLLKWDISRKLGLSPYQQFLSFIYESYMIVSFTIYFVFIQSLFFWNISHQGPALLKGIRVLLIAFWSSFTTALKLSLFYLSLLNPPVTFVIEPQQTAPPLTLGGNSEQH